jgi:formylglycine-generating enzyme required for sulfatase activity
MGIYQVTQAQYKAVMTGADPSQFKGDSLPVERVSWHDAMVFCNRLSMAEGFTPAYSINGSTNPDDWGPMSSTYNLGWQFQIVPGSTGYRLPTEEQWEYAARGDYPNKATEVNTKPFGIGDGTKMTGEMANFNGRYIYELPTGQIDLGSGNGTYLGQTTDVGSYAANNYGLYDIYGNVSEFTSSMVYAVPGYYVSRGGNWNSEGRAIRSAWREITTPGSGYRRNYYGFRLVRPSF